jgi:hypothetical protein
MRNVHKLLVRKPQGTRLFQRSRHKARMILKWILRETGYGLDSAGSGFTENREFLYQMSKYQLLKKDTAS